MATTQTLTANGNVTFKCAVGGDKVITASGTFGGGTLTWAYAADGVNFENISSGALTAIGSIVVSAGDSSILKATLAGSTSPSLNLTVAGA